MLKFARPIRRALMMAALLVMLLILRQNLARNSVASWRGVDDFVED